MHVTRFAYFGYALPNTALVQAKVAGVRQVVVLLLLLALFAVYVEVLRRGDASEIAGDVLDGRCCCRRHRFCGCLADARNLDRKCLGDADADCSSSCARRLEVVDGPTSRADLWRPDIVFAGLVFIPLAQVMLSGPARMDAFRVASLAVPWMAMWTAATAVRLVAISRVVDSRGRGRSSIGGWSQQASSQLLLSWVVSQQ